MSLDTIPLPKEGTLSKDYRMQVTCEEPPNLLPPLAILDEAVTPVERLFVRNHQPIPSLSRKHWELTIDGLVRHPLTIGFSDLFREPTSSFFAALIGRSQIAEGYAAIANVEWIGAPVALFLEAAGMKPQAGFAACWSYGPQPMVRYLPLSKLWQDGMLAYAINGQPLPPLHGGPVRLIVPGWSSAYWLKWIAQITLLSPEKAPAAAHVDGSLAIDCCLFNLPNGVLRPARYTTLRGAAWSAARGVAQVDISIDEGPWQTATLDQNLGPRAWRRFSFRWSASSGTHLLAVRVSDNSCQSAVRRWQIDVRSS